MYELDAGTVFAERHSNHHGDRVASVPGTEFHEEDPGRSAKRGGLDTGFQDSAWYN